MIAIILHLSGLILVKPQGAEFACCNTMSRKRVKAIICILVLVVVCSFAVVSYPIVASTIQNSLNSVIDDGSFAKHRQWYAHRKWLILQQKKWEIYQKKQKQDKHSGVSKYFPSQPAAQ